MSEVMNNLSKSTSDKSYYYGLMNHYSSIINNCEEKIKNYEEAKPIISNIIATTQNIYDLLINASVLSETGIFIEKKPFDDGNIKTIANSVKGISEEFEILLHECNQAIDNLNLELTKAKSSYNWAKSMTYYA